MTTTSGMPHSPALAAPVAFVAAPAAPVAVVVPPTLPSVPPALAPATTAVGPPPAVFAAPPVGVEQAVVADAEVLQPVVSTTTEALGPLAVSVAPTPPTAATLVPPSSVPEGPESAPLAAALPAQRPPSPGSRQHRPHSPAPWHGRGGGWVYDQPVTMADLQRIVSAAVREERKGQASHSNSPCVAPSHASLHPAAPYAPAPPLPQSAVPPPHAPSASAATLGNRMHLPWVPPVAGMEFVTAAGGPVTAQYPSLLPVAPAHPAAALPQQTLVGPSPSAVVPEASLGQLWCLSEGMWVVHLIQVYGHAALSQGVPLDGGPWDECLDAADRLGELLAPVLAAPARGGVAGAGQLGTSVRGLRRFWHAGIAVDLIDATTVVVRELHRSLTGLLAVLDADQM
ncbi:unnamed protein product [Closterium sp. Naga37s-1]|nr:unnamed protein product [Closterium sp. Naga37s-1]